MFPQIRLSACSLILLLSWSSHADELLISDDVPLEIPPVGAHQLRILSPSLLELTLVTTKESQRERVSAWNFVDGSGQPHLPKPGELAVFAGDSTNIVEAVGFKRRVALQKRACGQGENVTIRLLNPPLPLQRIVSLMHLTEQFPMETATALIREPLADSQVIVE